MQDRSKSYQSYGSSRSTSSGYTPYSSQTRISSYLGGSSETRSTPPPSYTSYGSEAQSTAYRASANEIRGADIVAEYLVKEKVPYILGYAGHGAIGLLDGIYKQTDRIRHVSPRIEQSAGFMADVYYRLTGQPLAVYASTGPGPMNLLISVTNAFYDGSAFFVITGQVPTNQFDSGALQDDYRYHGDMSAMFAPVVKKSWRIRKVEDLVKALPDAFSLMRTGRPGPVHFDMPYDLYMRTAAVSTPEPNAHGTPLNWRTTVADETVEKALSLLTNAQRPLILAGGGVRVGRAYEELKALAEQLDIPVYTSFMGKSALPADHRLNLGVAGVWGEYPATEAVRNADVILAIGARFNDLHTGSWIKGYVYNIPPTRLIQVDIDPEEIGRNYPVELGMVGDARAFLAQALRIARAKGLRGGYSVTWHKEIEGWRADWRN
jgi:acetolactate synthase-1/2/3 large subunit